jgi:hypothetical protein
MGDDSKSGKRAQRAERLARALRENLRRRKAQGRNQPVRTESAAATDHDRGQSKHDGSAADAD